MVQRDPAQVLQEIALRLGRTLGAKAGGCGPGNPVMVWWFKIRCLVFGLVVETVKNQLSNFDISGRRPAKCVLFESVWFGVVATPSPFDFFVLVGEGGTLPQQQPRAAPRVGGWTNLPSGPGWFRIGGGFGAQNR